MKFSDILLVISLICCMTSCATKEKFAVYGPQATKIYTPANLYAPVTITAPSDKVDVSISSDMYCGYILAQAPGSDLKIPIGLNYKIKRHNGTKTMYLASLIVTSIGMGGALGGGAMLIADSESPGGAVLGISAGVGAVGAFGGMVSQARMNQTAYDYNFGYEKKQKIEMPPLSTTLLNPNLPKGYVEEIKEKKDSTRKKASSGKDIVPDTQRSSKVNKSRSDIAKNVEGSYSGTGLLLYGKKVEEQYSDITIILERLDKSHVSVRIIESDEEYFDMPLEYVVSKGKNGSYLLSIEKLPEASIKIASNGTLTFMHKKVNIDNEIYTLEISGKKNKQNR